MILEHENLELMFLKEKKTYFSQSFNFIIMAIELHQLFENETFSLFDN
jgi:hypothetical protein